MITSWPHRVEEDETDILVQDSQEFAPYFTCSIRVRVLDHVIKLSAEVDNTHWLVTP